MTRLLLLLTLTTWTWAACAQTSHTFVYQPDGPVSQVVLAGSFNGWSQTSQPMTRQPDGRYTTTVKLPDGVHHYKFIVDGQWLNDPASDQAFELSDGHGGHNSAIYIGFDGRKLPHPKPGHIASKPLKTQAQVISDRDLRLTLRTQADDVQTIRVLIQTQASDTWTTHDMQKFDTAVGFDTYHALIQLPAQSATPRPVMPAQGLGRDSPRQIQYLFELRDHDALTYFTDQGLTEQPGHPFTLDMTPTFITPDWARDAVWYQIFPERFRNGDPRNDPKPAQRWQANWWATLPGEAPGHANVYQGAGNVWKRRFGGDLQGARQALPYLKELGVNAIYFNPLFEARSMHKYDATDLRHIDDNFGVKGDLPIKGETDDPNTWQWSESDRVFLDFIHHAHQQGFKIVIDGVFNHVGTDHPFFQDVLKKGKKSKYANWFEITHWGTGGKPGTPSGIQWHAWNGPNGSLPAFKKDPTLGLAHGPREHIIAITRRWLAPDGDPARGVDGIRLDAPQEIGHAFWRDWRTVVKKTKPDALIVGEIWSRADAYLQGDQYDSVMNYQFAMPTLAFFANQSQRPTPSQLALALNRVVYGYPLQASLVMMNLFDSHDTDRVASMFVNPDRPYDGMNRLQDGDSYTDRKPNALEQKRMKQAIAMQFAFLGAPMIYYGTEAGMWSPDDPSNRQPMLWQDHAPYDDKRVVFDPGLFAFYQRLSAIRQAFEPLRRGAFRVIQADDQKGTFAFVREGRYPVYVLINPGPQKTTWTVPVEAGTYLNVLDSNTAKVKIEKRPQLIISNNASPIDANDGIMHLTLRPHETAILVPAEQQP